MASVDDVYWASALRMPQASVSRYEGLPKGSGLVVMIPTVVLAYWVYSVIYNGLFGGLQHIPGPFLLRFTSVPRISQEARGNIHVYIKDLHDTYGPIVRIGPDRVSVLGSDESWQSLYGLRRKDGPRMYKDVEFYCLGEARPDLVGQIDDVEHARQRRMVSHVFSESAMKEQEPILHEWAKRFEAKLTVAAESETPADMVKMFNCVTFDMIADLTFAEHLNMLESGQYVEWVRIIFENIRAGIIMRGIREFSAITDWLLLFLVRRLPVIKESIATHDEFSKIRVNRRLAKTPSRPDFWTRIIANNEGKSLGLPLTEQYAIASTFMIAGSETTATALSGATFLLSQHPEYLHLLRDELATNLTPDVPESRKLTTLARLPWLNAILRETLRIYPPVPMLMWRRVFDDKNPLIVDGHVMPPGTRIGIPQYATYRNASLFHLPDDFRPERWMGDPLFKDDRLDAVEPFSVGPRNCVGKNLAWHQMRSLFVTFIHGFNFQLVDDTPDWIETQRVWMFWEKKPLRVLIEQRATS